MYLPLLSRNEMSELETPRYTAAQRMLGVGELLENVLLFVDEADVLRCRRVNRKFFEVVTYSKTLQRRLYLDVDDGSDDRSINPLAPTWFHHKKTGYRSSTIAARIDLVDLWAQAQAEVKPLWHKMFISKSKTKTCVIPVGSHTTVFYRRSYPDGMTFDDLLSALIAAFEIRKGRRSSRERLEELSYDNSVLIYWT
ncbi:hypothetical protein CKM354_000952900 [Cercospora kikuchii]|uniref:F-box domain-containing protein n=1 Tax=Cercospora kikuchii TaxID=84275 RepID=A0A9P3CP92_9PEZI|nr:uncharacterized protein CKM354_000952900 [Cercospora kikuchii]GIZ46403.1 hypothetical protein CKM354_000952900 [Cercospora kikuchii]